MKQIVPVQTDYGPIPGQADSGEESLQEQTALEAESFAPAASATQTRVFDVAIARLGRPAFCAARKVAV